MTSHEDTSVVNPSPQVSQVLAVAPQSAAGLMVIDTACQKTCVGRGTYLAHCDILRSFGLRCQWTPESENFRFGAGGPQQSSMLVAIPAGVEGEAMVILASLLDASIPLLAPLRLLSQLGAVLDLPKQSCRLHKIGVTVQLAKTLGGHLALRVTQFPKEGMPRSADMWHHKRQPCVEVVLDPAKSAASADADARGESKSTKHITRNTGMAEGTHVLAAAVSGSSSEAKQHRKCRECRPDTSRPRLRNGLWHGAR